MPRPRKFDGKARERLQAAERYLREGRRLEASDLYAEAGDFSTAARLAAEAGDERRAVAWSLKGALGKIPEGYSEASSLQAGDLLASLGHYREAISLFELSQSFRKAAESAVRLKQLARAARFYERARAWGEAAANFEKVGLIDEAQRALERLAERLETEARGRSDGTAGEQLRQVNGRRAELLERLGRHTEAAGLRRGSQPALERGRILEAAGRLSQAIEAYLQANRPDLALQLLARGDIDRHLAAQAYLRCGRPLEAGHLFAALGMAREAAESFEAAADWIKAATQWELARDPLRAAQAYLRIDRARDAARCFMAGGELQLAAASYARAGDHGQAASCYLRAGETVEAAREMLAGGDRAQAARILIPLQPGTPQYEEATFLLAPLLIDEGFFDDALRRLKSLPPPVSPAPGAARGGRRVGAGGGAGAGERLYWEARVLEQMGRSDESLDLYQRLVMSQPEHRDAATRLAGLRRRTPRPGPVSVSLDLDATLMPDLSSGLTSERVLPAVPLSIPSPLVSVPALPVTTPEMPVTAPWQPPAVGQRLAGRYELLAELGRGGMGRVYKAYDLELGETVAIKTVLSGDNPSEADRLLREIQISRRITHPNVVRVFDLGRCVGGIFVTMEYLEGPRLDEVIEQQRPLPLPQVRQILAEISAGLEEAHNLGVIHRDLKTSNVILTASRLKILDFGLARMEGFDSRLTQVGFAVGTPMYMSPEQLSGATLDARSDLYSLGVIAYTLIAGREPFNGATPTAIAVQHLQTSPPDIRRFRPELPDPWLVLLDGLLSKEPARRPRSAAHVIAALAGCN